MLLDNVSAMNFSLALFLMICDLSTSSDVSVNPLLIVIIVAAQYALLAMWEPHIFPSAVLACYMVKMEN